MIAPRKDGTKEESSMKSNHVLGIFLALTVAACATAGTTMAAGDPANGETIFKARCAACHTVTSDGQPGFTGPNLFGIIGRKAGTGMGFPYSDGMKNSGITWDAAKIKQYLAGPMDMIQGGKMQFVGPTDPSDVDDVIAYLETLK